MQIFHPSVPRLARVASVCAFLAAPALAQQNVFQVTTTLDTLDANPGDGVAADSNGECSLRAAIQEANALGGQTAIYLGLSATYTLTRAGAGEDAAATGDLDITARISIQGRSSSVNAGGLDRAFDVQTGGRLIANLLTISGGAVTDESGGGVRSAGDLLLSRCTIRDCVASGTGASGGGVFNDNGYASLDAVTITDCTATRAGGAIEANGGITNVDRSDLMLNQTGPMPGNGGALHLTGDGQVDVRGSRIEGNTADREGGGLWNSGTGSMTIDDCDFIANRALGTAADDGGGGVFNDGGFMEVMNSRFNGNLASAGSGSGGGAFNNQGLMVASISKIEGCAANRAGGGIEANAGTTVMWRVLLRGNDTGPSPGNGGGLHLTGAGVVRADDCVITSNSATAEGGGMWNSATGDMTLVGCTVITNTATGNDPDQGGGGLFNDGGTMTVVATRVRDNVANGVSGSGGGILNNQGLLEMTQSFVSGNTATRAGGGIEANIGTTVLTGVTLNMNSTGANPGNGGGLHLTGAGTVTISLAQIVSNHADAEGGGLWNSATGTMTVTNSTIQNNTAPIQPNTFNDGGTFTINGVPVPPGP